ncbi:Clr5 domain-containing protein [Madurella fahalii]|uniref:Clr5 domain-containing protein n=1 Tax=Madurella fahalii TaxID=1157608 RepID=A0ABQ0GLA4_9PEZI
MQNLYATSTDWETYRDTITRLYLDEKRPLQEVMEYMALNHQFLATVKMYRSRIRKWGLDKNNKAAEVAYMVRMKKHRDAAGKASCFFVRNRPVDWDDIERYLSRKPGFWDKNGSKLVDDAEVARQITCKTPPPEDAQKILEVPRKLDATRELRIHEEILRSFRSYMDGSFENGVWSLFPGQSRYYGAGGVEANARLNLWYNKLRNVADWPGRDADVVRMVNRLLDQLPQLIKEQDYTVFPSLMRCFFHLSTRRPAVGREVVRFVAKLCSVILGEHHPMSLAWSQIKTLTIQEYLHALQGTAKVRFDYLESRLGNGIQDENTINALREYLLVLRLRGLPAVCEIERVTAQALKQVNQADNLLSNSECRLLLGTASSLITCRRFEAAEEILDRVGAHLPASAADSPRLQSILSTYLFIMGFLRYVTGRLDEAINYFLQTYYTLEKAAGPQSSVVADILLALIDFPGLLQRPEDAEYWQRKFSQVQSDMLAKAEKDTAHTPSELGELWDEPLDMDVNTSMW